MKITKELYKKCRNELGQAFAFLDKETKQALSELRVLGFVEMLCCNDKWEGVTTSGGCSGDTTYRVSDSYTFTEERETVDVFLEHHSTYGWRMVVDESDRVMGRASIAFAPCRSDFVGIGYELNGVITLRTSVDAAFGTPKFVRLYKED